MAGSFSIQRENLKVYQRARGMVISARGMVISARGMVISARGMVISARDNSYAEAVHQQRSTYPLSS